MLTEKRKRRWIVLAFVLAVAALSAAVWHYAYRQALNQLSRRAHSDLALASDRLSTQLQVYQELAVLMSDHPALEDVRTDPQSRARARALLLEVADKTAALDVIFADTDGRVLVDATGEWVGDLARSRFFRRAMQGALGSDHGLIQPLDRRAYFYAAPRFGADGKVTGAVVVIADVEDVESDWRGSNPAVFFTDTAGDVFISNRSEILFWTRGEGQIAPAPREVPAPDFGFREVGGHAVWNVDWGPYIPARALHMVRDLPVIGLRGEILADVAPARRLAALQAAAVAAICLAFGALLYVATERRRTLAQANSVLESRVAERTRALSETNVRLRREVAERKEAEAALKQAQDDLVQAGKLGALGQMSAGISHELNQPLMAIRSFAENAEQFLERGRRDETARNLTRISDLARRMGRIIQNLRSFARNESEPSGRVDLVAVLDSAIELTGSRLRGDKVTLDYVPSRMPIWVRGGEVRLGQVFVNLITNAADAMSGQTVRRLAISVRDGDALEVVVQDTGPGIDMPDKMFEPFYSTKEVGAAEGVGLGLSISYGIVQSFGGDIRGGNAPQGGAVFTVTLERWVEEKAA